jgi:hypothetical protein
MFKKRKSAGASSRKRLSFDPDPQDEDTKEEIVLPKKKIKQFGGAVDLVMDDISGKDNVTSLLSKYGDAQSTVSKEQVYKDAIDQASDGSKDPDEPLVVDLDDHKRVVRVSEKEKEDTFVATSTSIGSISLTKTSTTTYDSNVIALNSKQVQANVTRAYNRLMDQNGEIAKVIDKLESELGLMKDDESPKAEAYQASQVRKDNFSAFYTYMKQVTSLLTAKSKQQVHKISALHKALSAALSNKGTARQELMASLGAEIKRSRDNSTGTRVKLGPCIVIVENNGNVSCNVQDMLMATDSNSSNSDGNAVSIGLDTLSTYDAFASSVSSSIKSEVMRFYQEHKELTSDSWQITVPSASQNKSETNKKEEVIINMENILHTISTFRSKHTELDADFVTAMNKQKKWVRGKDEEALDVYTKTYASLSLPEILHPLIMKDCLLNAICFACEVHTDAMDDDGDAIETLFVWINKSVRNYIDSMVPSSENDDADGDSTLIVRMLQHSIVPFCKDLVLNCFDPLYLQQWHYLVRCIQVCRSYEQKLPASEWKLKLNDGIQELTRLAAEKAKAVFTEILEGDSNDDNVDAMIVV